MSTQTGIYEVTDWRRGWLDIFYRFSKGVFEYAIDKLSPVKLLPLMIPVPCPNKSGGGFRYKWIMKCQYMSTINKYKTKNLYSEEQYKLLCRQWKWISKLKRDIFTGKIDFTEVSEYIEQIYLELDRLKERCKELEVKSVFHDYTIGWIKKANKSFKPMKELIEVGGSLDKERVDLITSRDANNHYNFHHSFINNEDAHNKMCDFVTHKFYERGDKMMKVMDDIESRILNSKRLKTKNTHKNVFSEEKITKFLLREVNKYNEKYRKGAVISTTKNTLINEDLLLEILGVLIINDDEFRQDIPDNLCPITLKDMPANSIPVINILIQAELAKEF